MEIKKTTSRYEKYYGSIILLDSLGTKGIWKSENPDSILAKWDLHVDTIDENIKKLEKDTGLKISLNAFSDTIIISIVGKEVYDTLIGAGGLTRIIITGGLLLGINFRGCISIGEFYKSNRMILGPAIDEAAQLYEKSNWIGAFTAPSAYSALLRLSKNKNKFSLLEKFFVQYKIPMKNGSEKNWATTFKIDWGNKHWQQFADGKNVIDYVHDILENSKGVEDGQKWKNLLDFLYFLKSTGKSYS